MKQLQLRLERGVKGKQGSYIVHPAFKEPILRPHVRIAIVKNKLSVFIQGVEAEKLRSCCRRLYATPAYVLKFDDFVDQSSNEWIRYNNEIRDEDLSLFVPIVDGRKEAGNISDDASTWGYVVQPRIRFRRGRTPYWAHLQAERLSRRYGFCDVDGHNYSITEENSLTYGYRFLCYDWGI